MPLSLFEKEDKSVVSHKGVYSEAAMKKGRLRRLYMFF